MRRYATILACVMIAVVARADQIDTTMPPRDINPFPDMLVEAVVAAEDPDFWNRPLWRSPITLQVAHMRQPSKSNDHRRQLFNVLKLDLVYSHDQILTYFLNDVYFGRYCYGAHAASIGLFHKEVEDITRAEAIILAALLRGPSGGFADDVFMHEGVSRITSTLIEHGLMTADERDLIITESSERTTARRRCRN